MGIFVGYTSSLYMDLPIISNVGVEMSWNTEVMHFSLEIWVFE